MRRILLPLLLTPALFGYIRLTTTSTSLPPSVPEVRVDNAGIQFYLNTGVVAGAPTTISGSSTLVITAASNPQQAVHLAMATWNAYGTPSGPANIQFLPLKTTTDTVDNSTDNLNIIGIGSSEADLSAVGEALAVTINSYAPQPVNLVDGGLVACSSNCQYPTGGIVYSRIIINPAETFTTLGETNDFDFQSVITHELGHSLSANHTGLIGATMFQTTYGNSAPVERNPSADDLALVESTYPSTTSPASFGTVSGTVTLAGTPVPYALLTLASSSGVTIGALTSTTGTYSIQVPPGSYQIYAEPLTGVVQAGNLYFTTDQAALVTGFLPTLYNGTVSVAANATATANIAVNAGKTALAIPYMAVTNVNADAPGFLPGGPAFVPSGQSVDLQLAGTGFNSSLTAADFKILGSAATVTSVKVDPSGETVNGATLLRVTLNVPAQQSVSLASIFITSGSTTFSLSGSLVIGPPTPTTTSPSMVSAASYVGNGAGNGAVSPGGIYALFDTPAGLNLGPATPVGNIGYDPYGFLSPVLGGVEVTFDGVPAPLFFVYGNQINLQAPFEIAGKTSTNVVVSYLGSASAPIAVPVLASQPAFFTVGTSDAIYVGNADYTVNTATNPAPRGSTITAYGTGFGAVNYPVASPIVTGEGAPDPTSFAANDFTCTVGGVNAAVAFAGWTPTAVGLAQWNVTIPTASSLTATGAVPLVCTNANGSTQSGLTVFVK